MGSANKVVIAYSAAGIIEIVAWYNDEETNAIRLLKSVDGALVVQHTSSAFGLCVIVPCGGSEDKWYRFKPSKGDAGQAPGRTSGWTSSTG
jgi:hypothetical protein